MNPDFTAPGDLVPYSNDRTWTVQSNEFQSIDDGSVIDINAEFEKDIWNCRLIPGAKISLHRANNTLGFSCIPIQFREYVKEYIRLRITRYSVGYLRGNITSLSRFLVYVEGRLPGEATLRSLSRSDVEGYLVIARARLGRKGNPRCNLQRYVEIMATEHWVRYAQTTNQHWAPTTHWKKLFWQHDRGRIVHDQVKNKRLKYIPEFVLNRVDIHIHNFVPVAGRAAVLLLRATGWRIGDILNLRIKTCLHKENGHWFLQGDITKTGVLEHRVPITEEVAEIVLVQIEAIKISHSIELNPLGLLFPATNTERKGLALNCSKIRNGLRDLVKTHNITDEMGNLYHFGCHAFRHTKAVELLNNGMPFLLVQKWLAHLSVEMTLVYAQITDQTMVRIFDEIIAKGVLRLSEEGQPKMLSVEELASDNNIEWERIRRNLDAVRVPDGYCFNQKKMTCEFQVIPCHRCVNFATTPEFLPQFKRHRDDALIQIDLGRAAGRDHWVVKNEKLLAPIEKIIQTLEKEQVHNDIGKSSREYSEAEQAKIDMT
jgi:integrase